ncbi:hypothetical protein HYN69_07035 [Gemmobacter aquarius]|uniref:Lipoprotein n=1 Tax=Paragemmobacter aquarius TaxID=2169400 RepID=A0A2S0UKF4_9RHOB|nr:hypothetical protein [Gemmobacter aquarius]AWB48298.1 hypothetical protein HYN69_07035 [Gemmobacter aquarius]
MTRVLLAAMLALSLTGCGFVAKSKLNPFNWFTKSEPRESIVLTAEKAETRDLAAEVIDMQVLPYSAGALIRATGRMPTQGWWNAELVARPLDENGVLVYDFRVFAPVTDTPVGTPQSREVTVAVSISPQKLDGVREIVVQGATNARSSRR